MKETSGHVAWSCGVFCLFNSVTALELRAHWCGFQAGQTCPVLCISIKKRNAKAAMNRISDDSLVCYIVGWMETNWTLIYREMSQTLKVSSAACVLFSFLLPGWNHCWTGPAALRFRPWRPDLVQGCGPGDLHHTDAPPGPHEVWIESNFTRLLLALTVSLLLFITNLLSSVALQVYRFMSTNCAVNTFSIKLLSLHRRSKVYADDCWETNVSTAFA